MSIANTVNSLRTRQSLEYNEIAPNQVPAIAMLQGVKIPNNTGRVLRTYNPNAKKMDNEFVNAPKYFRPPVSSEYITKTTAACIAASKKGWQSLIDMNNPRPVCGFVYKPPPTRDSPWPAHAEFVANINNQPPPPPIYNMPKGAKYFTDMWEASKVVNGNICRAMKTCEAVNTPPYNGLCGYAADMAHGIPAFAGQAIYNDEGLFAPAGTIISSAGKCPKPTPEQREAAALAADGSTVPVYTAETCYRDKESTMLKRECLLQQVKNAGCSDKGSLYRALNEGSPTNFASKLQQEKAYNEFQNRAFILKKPQLNQRLIEAGFGKMEFALNNFAQLQTEANKTAEKTAYNAAARDLCLNAGEFEKYDICNDLLPQTLTNDIPLECFQSYFRKSGGTPNGQLYPSMKNIVMIKRAYRRWADYTRNVQMTASMMDSNSFEKRKNAFLGMMGVVLKQGGASSLNYAPNEGFVGSNCQISEEQCTNRSTDPNQGSTGRDIAAIPKLSLEACKTACCKNAKCKYYTHVKDYMCFLKDGVCNSEPVKDCNVTSGAKA